MNAAALAVLVVILVACGNKPEEIRNARIISCWQGQHIDIEVDGRIRKIRWTLLNKGPDCISWKGGDRWTIVVRKGVGTDAYDFIEARQER